MTTQKPHHFFVCNVLEWHVSRDLYQLLRHYEKEKRTYWVWLVPGDVSSNYEINFYAPQVKGSKLLQECVFENGKRDNTLPKNK